MALGANRALLKEKPESVTGFDIQGVAGEGEIGQRGAVRNPLRTLFLKGSTQGEVKNHIGRSSNQEVFREPEVQGYIFRKS